MKRNIRICSNILLLVIIISFFDFPAYTSYSINHSYYNTRGQEFLKNLKANEKESDIATKIASISRSLGTSSSQLNELQKLLEQRIRYVKDLDEQAKKAENIASLKKEQVDAINSLLNFNLKKESKSNFWRTFVISFMFFILGALVSYLIS